MSDQRLPPHDDEMEQAVIGCVLQSGELINDCVARFKVGPDVFFDLRNRNFYKLLVAMRNNAEPIDAATVSSKFKDSTVLQNIGGMSYFLECVDKAISISNFEHYADRVSQCHVLRRIVAVGAEAVEEAYSGTESADSVIDDIEAKLESLRETRGTDEIVAPKKAANLLNGHLEQRFTLQGRRSGIETGLTQFDSLTDGLQLGELTIIGARPSQGKTSLATTIIDHACLGNKVPTLVVTLEMSIAALCRRILARHCRFPMNDLRSGQFSDGDFERFGVFSLTLSKSPIYFLDSIGGTNSGRVCRAIRRTVKAHGIKLVVVDYLQKIRAVGNYEKRTYEVAEVSTELKAVAVETGVAMLTLAQLNREPDKDKKPRPPRVSDLADSSQIERDADTIGLLHRDREKGGETASLIIAKQRDGEVGICTMAFAGQFASFENVAIEQPDYDPGK